MSSLWTPEGEHRVPAPGTPSDAGPEQATRAASRPGSPAGGRSAVATGAGATGAGATGADGGTVDEETEAQLAELRRHLLATPVEVVVANHAYGLFELAAIHLSEQPPRLAQARLAIDALGALVQGLAGRLGEAEPSLTDALTQLRLAFVQLQADPGAGEAG